jgi:hypothetical protein
MMMESSSTSTPMLSDPFREMLLAVDEEDLPERIRQCAEHLRGEPAFDPKLIERLASKFQMPSGISFPHPMLEKVVRVGLAHIEATFRGDHPKYGTGAYADEIHDGFPPTIIATVDALTLWGFMERAKRLFSYWLNHFVNSDGTINYYGPAISEYGQLLTTAKRLVSRSGDDDWLKQHEGKLALIVNHLREKMHQEGERPSLLKGVPEADEHKREATYFHNNAWVVRGFSDYADLVEQALGRRSEAEKLRKDALALRKLLLDAIEATWSKEPKDWWLPPMLEEHERPQGSVTSNRLGSYTNYRYWLELLSSGVLPRKLMRRLVRARLNGGGQFLGMTRFMGHLDDWTLMEYLDGLWKLGMRKDYLISLWGHIYFHQCEGHLTAYEQVTLPPGRKVADYCLPCQLVAVRAIRRIVP